jgi:hypothetical protein
MSARSKKTKLLSAALLFQATLAFGANKCIVDGRTVYMDGPCPQGSMQKPMAPYMATPITPGGALPKLPNLQSGQWKMSGQGDWSACGHPLKSTYDEYEQFGKLREMGCSVLVTTPGARSVAVSVTCPDSSKIGKVDTAFTLSSPNPQSFAIESTLKGRTKTLKGVRIGEC